MTEDQMELLLDARDSVAAAKLLLEGGFAGYAAARAYYAMFYVAEAFLEGEEMSFSKHSAVIAAFGQEFAKTGRVPEEMHRYLLDAQRHRHQGDYGPRDTITAEAAREQIARAEQFLTTAEQRIGKVPPAQK